MSRHVGAAASGDEPPGIKAAPFILTIQLFGIKLFGPEWRAMNKSVDSRELGGRCRV